MTTLTKAKIAEGLIVDHHLHKRKAKVLVELFFELIGQGLEQGEAVKLSGFGNFHLRDKAERPGRNPKTGESIPISPRRVVTFRPGHKLRVQVESYQAQSAEGASDSDSF